MSHVAFDDGRLMTVLREPCQAMKRIEETQSGKRRGLKVARILLFTLGLVAFIGESALLTASSVGYYLAGGPSPEEVQCSRNGDCIEGSYCEKAVGDCGGEGRCAPRPEVCMEVYLPVCGCDGTTYSNACKAAQAGQPVDHDGPCTP